MPLLRKKIPSSGEELPVIGLGTARRYERPGPGLRETLARFGALGATVIDTAPVYGDAETVVGDLIQQLGSRERLFLATKVSIRGREAGVQQIEQSFRQLRTSKIDLIAVHNLRDTETHLATLRELKKQGRIRYIGITTSSDRQYADFEQTMRRETLDFIQVDARQAAARVDRGLRLRQLAAVLPEVHRLAPAVTCAVPGMARPEYVDDNLGAARGRLPEAAQRRRMESFIDAI